MSGDLDQDIVEAAAAYWADQDAVDELKAYIVDDANKFTAPEGQHDDRLMARMITAKVASTIRAELARRPMKADWGTVTDTQRRILEDEEAYQREEAEARQRREEQEAEW